MKKPTGYILYQGPSVLDGAPIVVIATLSTANPKTGDMVQTWIIRSDMRPQEAVNSGSDGAICGNCPHKHNNGGACYVIPWQGPTKVYDAFKAGKYPWFDTEASERIKGRSVRLGAYGDPAAVPFKVWQLILHYASGHTGYTHQAKHKHFDQRIANVCMVSADTPRQAESYQRRGWRTFRVKTKGAPLLPDEITCLNTSKGISCADCLMCDGIENDVQGVYPSIAIDIHGARSKRYDDKYRNVNMIAREHTAMAQRDFEARDPNGKGKRYEFDGTAYVNGRHRDLWTSWELIEIDGSYVHSRDFSTPHKAPRREIIEVEFTAGEHGPC